MSEQIAMRIAGDLGLPDLVDTLADKVSGADLHSLMLMVLKRRVAAMNASQLTQLSAVTKTCDLDARLLNKVECLAYETASDFEARELSPLMPLGAVSVLTGLDQGNVLSTVRAFECAADPTVSLALECSRRRKNIADRKETVRLCTNQRVVRFPLPQHPDYTAHFKLFSMVTSGRDSGSFAFELAALKEHIGFYLDFLLNLQKSEFAFADVVVEISDTRVVAHLCDKFKIDFDQIKSVVRARDSSSAARVIDQYENTWPKIIAKPAEELASYDLPAHLVMQLKLLEEKIVAPLQVEYEHVRVQFNMQRLTGLAYYKGPCFHIKMKNSLGDQFMLADGGFVNWTQQLLADKKERLMTSAIGTELICRAFRGK